MGPPSLKIYPWDPPAGESGRVSRGPIQSPGGTSLTERPLESFYFYRFADFPDPSDENVTYFIELLSLPDDHAMAERRRDRLEGQYQVLLLGIDPGPLPGWVEAAYFASWRVVHSGPHQGDIEITCARPGSQVMRYSLEFTGGSTTATVATLGSGADVQSIGGWQVVRATVPAEMIEVPDGSGIAFDAYEIEFETDNGEPIPHRVAYTIELPEGD